MIKLQYLSDTEENIQFELPAVPNVGDVIETEDYGEAEVKYVIFTPNNPVVTLVMDW